MRRGAIDLGAGRDEASDAAAQRCTEAPSECARQSMLRAGAATRCARYAMSSCKSEAAFDLGKPALSAEVEQWNGK